MKNLEQEIRQIIDETIEGKYTGKLKVEKEQLTETSTLWLLLLFLDRDMTPMVLAYEGTINQFKDFIRQEIKSRKLHYVKYWKGVQEFEINEDDE